MKKILLSCACCLLAVGLLAGCDDEVEEPEDPNAGVVEPSGDDSGTGGGESGGTETTYKLGVLNENLYSYYYFDGTLDGRFASGTDEWDKGVSLTVTTSEEGSTLSWEEEGVTYYLGYGVNESSQNIVTITTEVSYLVINEEHDSIEDPSGKYFLGTYNEYTTFSWNGVSYYDDDFIAHLYTSAQTNPIAPAAPEPTGEMVEVETGVLGLYQGNKGNYYYFTGEINSSNFGVLSTDFTKAVEVTEWKDDAYYYLTIGSEESLQYIACPATSTARMSLTNDPYCLLVDETTGAFVTGDGKEFLGTYQSYETMSWSSIDYLGQSGQFIATIYKEEQKLPAPEAGSITISGATSVYVDSTITLTAVIPTGYDSSVEWSIDSSEYATIEESSGLTCVVKGVSEGDATVTVKSTVNEEAYATTTISVIPIPTGVTLLGTFDFSSHTSGSDSINSSTYLDDYWTGNNSLFLGLRQYTQVSLGGDGSYAPSNSADCIKFGTSSAEGLIEFKFALGTSITEVVVTASGWGTSTGVSAATLTVNGVSQACATSGTHEELTYSITDNWTNLVKMESTNRLTIQSIDIYGTYTSEFGQIESLTLSAETSEVEAGEHIDVSVSWSDDVPFDIDTLTWASDNSEVATVEATYDGGRITGVAAGDTSISATAENGVKGEFTVKVTAVEIGDTYEVEVTAQYIIDHYMFDDTNHFELGSGSVKDSDPCTLATSNSPRTLDFYEVFSITWTGGDTATRLWNGNQIRMYNNSYFVISPESGWEITSLSITDTNKKLTQYEFYTIASGDVSTKLTSETDYTITGSGEQFDTAEDFSTTDDFKVLHAGSGSSNNSTFTSIKITCAKTSV